MEEYFTADYLGVVLVGVLGGVVDQPVEVVGLEEGHFLVPCACACAGGGGAGCSKELRHSCHLCNPRRLI